jgi:FMN phosphatase YigB (HAD superfamily)
MARSYYGKVVLVLESTRDPRSPQDARIRAICLDFGNVLVPFDYNRLWHGLSQHSTLSESEMAQHFSESDLPGLYESGKMSSRQFYREMCALFKIKMSYEEFCGEWSSIFDRSSTVELPFLSLLARHYVLVLLSNTNEIHFAFMREQYSILQAFHYYALSYQIGVTKPGKEIYAAALDFAHVSANEAFYADDMKDYVNAALGLGFRAVQVSTKDELVGAMTLNGIKAPP